MKKGENGFVKAMGSPHSWNKKCVSVKITDTAVFVKDSKNEESPILSFTHDEWKVFVEGVKNNEFDI